MAISSVSAAASAVSSYQANARQTEFRAPEPPQPANDQNAMEIKSFEAETNRDREERLRPPPERTNLPPGVGTKINQLA